MRRIMQLIILFASTTLCAQEIVSPNGKIELKYNEKQKNSGVFSVSYKQATEMQPLIEFSALGVEWDSYSSSPQKLKEIIREGYYEEEYSMLSGKRKECNNKYNEYSYCFIDNEEKESKLVFRLYNDGVAFRYEYEGLNKNSLRQEHTTYQIEPGTKRWMQKYDLSYENFYPCTTDYNGEEKWGYPALFEVRNATWLLLSEANIRAYNSASWLVRGEAADSYRVEMATNEEAITGSWASPWRLLIIGSLTEVVESTLVTDVSDPSTLENEEWIKPGVVSWVYWAYNRGSKEFPIVKQYIDMADTLKLPYVLIDWEWDIMGNGGNIHDAINLAKKGGIKPLLWYNSSTAWTTNGAGGPLYRLNKPEDRAKEYQWLQANNVAGVKIDFFSGDDQETMNYCIDLIKDAAEYELLVNLHGATIPRGWQRTYPNLMTIEGVYGAEWYNNAPILTNKAAAHNTTLPFTRNVIGSMDYTPCTFSDSQHPHITSDAHELALTIVFESALQHLADKPESYLSQPVEIQKFLSQLPTVWEDTKLLSGYPGESVVIARKHQGKWFIGGLNGKDEATTLAFDLSLLKDINSTPMTVITDQEEKGWRIVDEIIQQGVMEVNCKPRGGFVIIL